MLLHINYGYRIYTEKLNQEKPLVDIRALRVCYSRRGNFLIATPKSNYVASALRRFWNRFI